LTIRIEIRWNFEVRSLTVMTLASTATLWNAAASPPFWRALSHYDAASDRR